MSKGVKKLIQKIIHPPKIYNNTTRDTELNHDTRFLYSQITCESNAPKRDGLAL